MCICTIKVRQELRQLRIPRTAVFPRAAREPFHNDGCCRLPPPPPPKKKSLETRGLGSITKYLLAWRNGGGGDVVLLRKSGVYENAADVSASQNSRCIRKMSQKLEKTIFLYAITSLTLENWVFLVQKSPCLSLYAYYGPQLRKSKNCKTGLEMEINSC